MKMKTLSKKVRINEHVQPEFYLEKFNNKKNVCEISELARKLLLMPGFPMLSSMVEINIDIISVGNLGFSGGGQYGEIISSTNWFSLLSKCPQQTAAEVCMQNISPPKWVHAITFVSTPMCLQNTRFVFEVRWENKKTLLTCVGAAADAFLRPTEVLAFMRIK